MVVRVLSGKLFLPDDVSDIKNTTIFVSVEDISKQDISSETICKKTYRNVTFSKFEHVFPFSLDVPITDEKLHLIVKIHVDVDEDGQLSVGDYITTGMFSVLTRGYSDVVDIKLEKIK